MLNVVVPAPVPLVPPVSVIHVALLAADQLHPASVVTADDPVDAPAPTDTLDGEIEYVHGAADCVTVNVWPAIVSVPVRDEALGFDAILNVAEPSPLPDVAPTSVSHDALLAAVQAQPAGAATVAKPLPAAAVALWLVGVIAYVHAAAACVTVKVCPPIVSVPTRCDPFGFAVTLNAVVPLPLPLAPLVIVNHVVSLLDAVHAQPFGAVMFVEPVPPAATTDWLAGDSENVQPSAACDTV
jgi:hypothetical protein